MKKNRLLIIVGVVYATLFATYPQQASKAVSNSVYYLVEMFEVLPVIFILTVIIEAWIPKEVIIKRFGEKSGFMGNMLSLMLGSISAGPIYAAFPISKMLLSKGASVANVVIVLSSWAVIKVPMLANEAKFLGVQFMAVRWILTVVAIFLMAYIIGRLIKKENMTVSIEDHEKEWLEVKKEYCIGCGICVKLLPDVYELNQNKAQVKALPVKGKYIEAIQQSIEKCPTKAITFYGDKTT
ncbi:MAG: permease [Firmicutes bacterium HGW-Firmicutes-7]|nr:MAG: permease [Firmicutes bacterium HGW-Firmicutes-7]